jgi:peptidoglycan/LPS O-acetylase OafA/YrhL
MHDTRVYKTRESGGLSIADALRGHNNSFGALRLALAALVIFSHSHPLGGWDYDPTFYLWRSQTHLGDLAVFGFLAISGYVVTTSAANTDVVQFFWRRALRIFPGFWVALVVVAFVIGPVAWWASGEMMAEYFAPADSGPVSFLLSNWSLVITQAGIHDLFQYSTPYGLVVSYSTVNGSLWSLELEWICYVIIGGIALSGMLTKARLGIPILTGLFAVMTIANLVVPGSVGVIAPFFEDERLVRLLFVFFCGATLAVYAKRIPFSDGLGVGALVVLALSLWNGGYSIVGIPALSYAVVWLAVRLPKAAQRVGQKNDYSYSLYLYGWPIQQFAAQESLTRWGFTPYFLLCLTIAAGLAWLSWHLVERPALRLKNWGPGKGVQYWVDRAKVRPLGLIKPSRMNDLS